MSGTLTTTAELQAYGATGLISGQTSSGTQAVSFRYDGTMSTWNGTTEAWGGYNTIWNAGNFNPANYSANGTPASFTGLVISGAADTLANVQGLHARWNETGGSGAGSLVVNQGGGPGGFIIRQVNLAGTTQVWAWTIDSSGDVTVQGNETVQGTLAAANLSTAGGVSATGQVQGGTVVSNGNSYAGGTGGAYMGTNGDITGTVWGGALSTHLNSTFVASAGNAYMKTDNAHVYEVVWDGGSGHLDFYVDSSLIGYVASDARAKENIEMSKVDSLARIDAMQFVSFDYKDEPFLPRGHVDVGVTTQQIEEINPRWVRKNGENGYDGIEPAFMLLDAMHAIQQLSARVHALENALGV